MKKFLLKMINIYQNTPGNFHNHCRFIPTCSEYSKEAIEQYGSFKGCFLAIKRIFKCNPFVKGGYDPVPIKRSEKK